MDIYKKFGFFDTINSIGTELMLTAIKNKHAFKVIDIDNKQRKDTSRFYAKKIKGNLKILKAMTKIIYKFII